MLTRCVVIVAEKQKNNFMKCSICNNKTSRHIAKDAGRPGICAECWEKEKETIKARECVKCHHTLIYHEVVTCEDCKKKSRGYAVCYNCGGRLKGSENAVCDLCGGTPIDGQSNEKHVEGGEEK